MARFAHQEKEIAEHAHDPARALFWSPRTGKTHGAGGQAEVLASQGLVKRIVVVAPQLVCKTVWAEEFGGPTWQLLDLSSGSITKRKCVLQKPTLAGNSRAFVVLVNWDVLAALIHEILAWEPQMVIADEAHFAKSAGAARSRALHRLSSVPYRRILTGTPTPRDYIDLYSQMKFLQPTLFGTSKAAFLKRYVEPDPWGRPKFYRNLPELRAKMRSVANVFDRAKAWQDLPPQVVPRRLFLPADARTLYDNLVRKTVAEWRGIEIDATHKLARLTKLQELTAGFVYDEAGDVVWVHTVKIDAACSEIAELVNDGEKVVVFYHFAPEGEKLAKQLRAELGGTEVVWLGGHTKPEDRVVVQRAFQQAKHPSVVVIQDSLGVGIKLSRASYMVRMSYPLDYAAYYQSNERIYEPGKALSYIEFEVDRTVDAFARRVCMDKKRASDVLLDFEETASGGAA